MTVKALRIGNNVHFNKGHKEIGVITGIVENILEEVTIYLNHRIDITYKLEDLEPIPLTHDLLSQLNFEKIERRSNEYSFEDYLFITLEDDTWENVSFDFRVGAKYITQVSYVHTLQNLVQEIDRTQIKL